MVKTDGNRMLTKEELNKLFEYKDGELFWKVDRTSKTKAGMKAGEYRQGTVGINNKDYQISRIIYCMHHGIFPKYIRFIDGDKLNFKIENLTIANRKIEKYIHPGLTKGNTSGFKGVYWNKREGKWLAMYINKDRKLKSAGYFFTPQEAYDAYCNAIKKHYGIDINDRQKG